VLPWGATIAIEAEAGMIHLEPMTEAEFQAYLKPAIDDYGQGHVKSGRWRAEEATEKSAAEFRELLPNGVHSADQHLFAIKDEAGTQVGMLWFAVRDNNGKRSAFIYDVRIGEAFQRRGYATQAFQALETLARDMGLAAISLHVFGHNTGARALYEKLGYIVTNLHMTKSLSDTV
jgi:RimJ/RimL family protein N-acetyltransferase